MTLKKVLFVCVVWATLLSCSSDSIENENYLKSKTDPTQVINLPGSGTNHDYEMPLDDQYLDEDLLIKIIYFSEDEEARKDIRRKFYQNYPDLVLVKAANLKSPVEFWFLKSLEGFLHSGSIQDLPEEDEDPNSEAEAILILRKLLQDILDHEFIDLYEEETTRN